MGAAATVPLNVDTPDPPYAITTPSDTAKHFLMRTSRARTDQQRRRHLCRGARDGDELPLPLLLIHGLAAVTAEADTASWLRYAPRPTAEWRPPGSLHARAGPTAVSWSGGQDATDPEAHPGVFAEGRISVDVLVAADRPVPTLGEKRCRVTSGPGEQPPPAAVMTWTLRTSPCGRVRLRGL